MKNIYTFGRRPAQRNYTVKDLIDLKKTGKRLTMCNPANEAEIRACVDAGIDLLTLWDVHLEMAREIAPTHFAGTAMNWGQFATKDEIMRHAIDCMENGADMYFTNRSYDVVEMLAKEGIPVQVHMGLVPSLSHWCGGLRAFGRTAEEAMQIHETFKSYENAGAFACEIECVAEDTLRLLNDRTSIVTISLGSGNAGDVIFLFMADICGEADNPPRHAHAFRDLGRLHKQMYQERVEALQEFQSEVRAKNFPYKAQAISMHDGELEKLHEALDKL
ncbi:3-methyl-2-oxobutanoate hydroxymethyltransferase [Leisingera sp. ANG-Vp]|uniref:3-methyl-2-oxobutanoate hydroxymethyltransferase n=1 Tax=Leisingera sp. ANG-Vp TaxID=1577896 RepID=UPI00057EC57B|nr:3-methyl-2-oxobutanoate hydroxymethyltransferase [Leisingera sp. ANG-Vp]KIC21728.1 hydroxymethyltransferase [Leisingera sp. ANG-Vp]